MPRFCPSPDTFGVEEVPAYLPSGAGEHTFAWIEKRSLTTLDAVNTIARRLDVNPRDIGYAGMKDRNATTGRAQHPRSPELVWLPGRPPKVLRASPTPTLGLHLAATARGPRTDPRSERGTRLV